MSNTGDSSGDKQQSAGMTTDYRALLAITRPLIVTEHSLLSWRGGEVYRSGFGVSAGPGDRYPESTVSRGEVFRSDETGLATGDDAELAAAWDEMRIGSALQLRICIGMS